MTKPNILLILNDHQAFYRRGWDGGVKPLTPHFDRLAGEGIRFGRAYTPTALCVPARRSMWTGLFPHNHGLATLDEDLEEKDANLLFHHLEETGYQCFYYGKWHNGKAHLWQEGCEGFAPPSYGNPYATAEYRDHCRDRGIPEARGYIERAFDHRIETCREYTLRELGAAAKISGILRTPKESHEAYFVTGLACEQLQRLADSTDPWFMVVSFWGPHRPYVPSSEYADLYNPNEIAPYGSFAADPTSKPATYTFEHNDGLHDGNGKMVLPSPIPWSEWQRDLARCYAQITLIDAAGGMVLKTLDRLGLGENTVVFWTTDHGDAVASHGGHATKGPYMMEETYRVPFGVRGPCVVEPGRVSQALVSHIDLAPTLLEIAGTSYDRPPDGMSLVPMIKDHAENVRADLVCEFNGLSELRHFARMIVSGCYKYIATQHDTDELYDLDRDPYQLANLISDEDLQGIREKMRAKLLSWQDRTNDPIEL